MGLELMIDTSNKNIPVQIDSSWPMERQILIRLFNNGITKKRIADESGIDRTYVSRYSNGKLYECVENTEAKLRDYFKSIGEWPEEKTEQSYSGFKRSVDEIGIIATKDHARVLGVCQRAQTRNEFCLVVGPPGAGKTKAIGEYAENNTGVYVVTCSKKTKTKTLLQKIATALEIQDYGASGALELRIIKKLKKMPVPSLLILDEADFLNLDSLETIRYIFDEITEDKKSMKMGILLCGNEKLAEDIILYAEEKRDYERLRDRIGYFQRLSGLGELEADRFLEGINCTQEAKKLLISIGTGRSIRQLVMALKRLLDVTEGKLITGDLVRELGQIVLSFNA